MKQAKETEVKPLVVSVPLDAEQRERFERFMATGAFIRGRWIAQAITEKMDRDSQGA